MTDFSSSTDLAAVCLDALEQIWAVCLDNRADSCDHKMALDFVRQIAGKAVSSCGAESNRHSGAVGADKRAEQSNPGGGHVTEPQLSEPFERKPAGMNPRPAGYLDAAQASPGREEIENYIHHQISGHLHPETARQIAQRAAQFAAPQPASNAYTEKEPTAVERFQKRVVEMIQDGCTGFHFSTGHKWHGLTIEEKCAFMLQVWDAKREPLDFKDSRRTSELPSTNSGDVA